MRSCPKVLLRIGLVSTVTRRRTTHYLLLTAWISHASFLFIQPFLISPCVLARLILCYIPAAGSYEILICLARARVQSSPYSSTEQSSIPIPIPIPPQIQIQYKYLLYERNAPSLRDIRFLGRRGGGAARTDKDRPIRRASGESSTRYSRERVPLREPGGVDGQTGAAGDGESARVGGRVFQGRSALEGEERSDH